jgi:hypothetical protein
MRDGPAQVEPRRGGMLAMRMRILALVMAATALMACEAVLGLGSLGDRPDGGGDDATSDAMDATSEAMDATSEVQDATSGDAETGSTDAPPSADANDAQPDVIMDAGCPDGASCSMMCPDGGTTTLSGTVYDPAAKNPLSNVAVYVVASTPLIPLPKGVPTGSDSCTCGALFKTPAVTYAYTAADGTFILHNVPVGNHIPLVIQVGKWRRLFFVDVLACQDNPQPDRSLALPSSVSSGDTDDNMPDIAVSTGAADSLECLLTRMGLPTTEYVAGTGTSGHVHIFTGGDLDAGGGGAGQPEANPMAGAPPSSTSLWATQDQLMPYDIVLMSCEGGETYSANPPALEAYVNAGGRVFASHYHYAWFSGPMESSQSYVAPADWGTNLATWSDPGAVPPLGPIGAIVSTSFPEGQVLQTWLSELGALQPAPGSDAGSQDGAVPTGDLPVYTPRFNASVGAANAASQAWISVDPAMTPGVPPTMYFSFDTPVNPQGGPHCGRAVFSDLHVGGYPTTIDNEPTPGGCAKVALSPQEDVLEFMLFDLSSCLTQWTP